MQSQTEDTDKVLHLCTVTVHSIVLSTDDLSVKPFMWYISIESAGRPQISGNVANKDTPDPRSAEQLAVVLIKLLFQLVLLEFLCGEG